MTKKAFVGEKQNLPQLAGEVATWLGQQGFEAQTGAGTGAYLIQARKKSTWRTILGSNQTIDVRIEGTPENYSIGIEAGTWIKNLTESGPAAIAAAVLYAPLAAISAAWSASERGKLEAAFWAVNDASCRKCNKLGAVVMTGEKYLRTEGVTALPSGEYQGTKVFSTVYKCKFCSADSERGETKRSVVLCPTCHREGTKESAGEEVLSCHKLEERNEIAQPLGRQTYKAVFRCQACQHTWSGPEKIRQVGLCPACDEAATTESAGEEVLGYFEKPTRTAPVRFQVYTENYGCRRCGAKWNVGKKARKG